ncbi:MAG: hypothetical protein M1840_003418 [Geoglossum simile]|nr:MAG: hypothetical protein M1840_003418 [Geoglossum simile]
METTAYDESCGFIPERVILPDQYVGEVINAWLQWLVVQRPHLQEKRAKALLSVRGLYSHDLTIGIAYIYCNFQRKGEHKINDLLASLLKQLAQSQSSLPRSVKELWIIHAKRQITTIELQHALAVEVCEPKLDKESFPQVQDIVLVCAGLVTVDEESNIIHLVHYTPQEYFERTSNSWFPDAQIDITKSSRHDYIRTSFMTMQREIGVIMLTPEIPIRHGFYQVPETGHQDFVLHNVSPPIVDHDISIFFEHKLGVIKRELALAADWPSKQTIKRLVQSASGLFIWAATACRFISDGGLFAERRLSLILQSNTSVTTPEEKLNEIYIAILKNSVSGNFDNQEKEELYKTIKATLGSIVILFSSLSAVSLAKLLHIPEMRTDQMLGNMHSIIEVPKDQDHPIRLHHPSFRDFLLDKQRCCDERFWVDEKKAHKALAKSCLRLMSKNLKKDICDLRAPGTLASEVDSCRVEQCLPADLQYACRYWVQHLQQAQIDLCSHGQIYEFFQKHFLHWLEALSLIGKISEGGHMVTELSTYLSTLQPGEDMELHAIMYDAKRFILKNGSVIEMAPLQVYS